MRRLGVLVFGLVFIASVNRATVVRAEVITSAPNNLQVQAQVLPRQSILLNSSGQIITIVSNTNEDVVPRVYQGSLDPANELPLTSEIMERYRATVPLGTNKPGVIKIYIPALLRINDNYLQPAQQQKLSELLARSWL